MIRTLRAYFLTRLLREKLLLLGFILIGTLWWFSSVSSRGAKFWRDQNKTSNELKEQQQWIDNKVVIDQAAKKAASRLESAQTLDRARLLAAVNQAASEVGLKNGGTTSPDSQSNGQFTVHSITYQVTGAEYETLLKFYLKLSQRAPYLGVESFQLYPSNPNDPTKFTLNLRISSVETPQG
jgi:Tfp pilus assembly protein PilO